MKRFTAKLTSALASTFPRWTTWRASTSWPTRLSMISIWPEPRTSPTWRNSRPAASKRSPIKQFCSSRPSVAPRWPILSRAAAARVTCGTRSCRRSTSSPWTCWPGVGRWPRVAASWRRRLTCRTSTRSRGAAVCRTWKRTSTPSGAWHRTRMSSASAISIACWVSENVAAGPHVSPHRNRPQRSPVWSRGSSLVPSRCYLVERWLTHCFSPRERFFVLVLISTSTKVCSYAFLRRIKT